MNTRNHLNSLGYVVGGRQGRPLIAWGVDQAGNRVSISDAFRGGSQGLQCDCGAALVAKKGDIKAHHFAHKAGGTSYCETAAQSAILTFISDTLLEAGVVSLPLTGGLMSRAEVHAVGVTTAEGHQVHLVDAQRERQLLVFARLKRHNVDGLKDFCRRSSMSGILIDLVSARNLPDDMIKAEIIARAPRTWLFRSPRNDHQAQPRVLRQIYLYS